MNLLFVGKIDDGKALLQTLKGKRFDWAVAPETLPDDYLDGKVSIAGLAAIFLPVDETRESILTKQKKLHQIVTAFPQFRAGLFQLAITYLQLSRQREALEWLEKYHALDPTHPVVEYYLAILAKERWDYPKAWRHLHLTEEILAKAHHKAKALHHLRDHLRRLSPEVADCK